ncbi:MAG: VOC family protein [Planctomycetota bacterium]
MKVQGIDHLQLEVADLERSHQFYVQVPGMEDYAIDESDRIFLRAGRDVLTLVRGPSERDATSALQHTDRVHFGFLTESEQQLREWRAHLQQLRIPLVDEKRGDQGWSLYVRDPDGYLVELFYIGRCTGT